MEELRMHAVGEWEDSPPVCSMTASLVRLSWAWESQKVKDRISLWPWETGVSPKEQRHAAVVQTRKEVTELGTGLWGGAMPGGDRTQLSHTRAMLPRATLPPPEPVSSGRGLSTAPEPSASQSISVFRTDVSPDNYALHQWLSHRGTGVSQVEGSPPPGPDREKPKEGAPSSTDDVWAPGATLDCGASAQSVGLRESPEPEGRERRQQDGEEVVTTSPASSDSEDIGSTAAWWAEGDREITQVCGETWWWLWPVKLQKRVEAPTRAENTASWEGPGLGQQGSRNERSQGCGCSRSRALSSHAWAPN